MPFPPLCRPWVFIFHIFLAVMLLNACIEIAVVVCGRLYFAVRFFSLFPIRPLPSLFCMIRLTAAVVNLTCLIYHVFKWLLLEWDILSRRFWFRSDATLGPFQAAPSQN